VVALDGIQDRFNERTRILGLLDEKQQQQRSAQALQLRSGPHPAVLGQGRHLRPRRQVAA
jgi:hypothetical protein